MLSKLFLISRIYCIRILYCNKHQSCHRTIILLEFIIFSMRICSVFKVCVRIEDEHKFIYRVRFFIKRIGSLYWENTKLCTWIRTSSFKILKLYLFNVKIKWNHPIYVAFLKNHRGIPTSVLLELFRFKNGIILYALFSWNHRNLAYLTSKYPENPQSKHINFVKWQKIFLK